MYFKHKDITDPAITPTDAIVQATKELTNTLKDVGAPPLAQARINQLQALGDIFSTQPPKHNTTSMPGTTEPNENSPVVAPSEGDSPVDKQPQQSH